MFIYIYTDLNIMFTYIVCYTHHCNGRVEGPL